MKIVMISDQFPPVTGGTERQAAALARALAARGHEVIVYTARWTNAWPAEETRDGYRLRRITTWNSFWNLRGLRRYGQDVFARNLSRALRTEGTDASVFHAHLMRRGAAVAVAMGRKLGVPVLVKETSSGAKNSFSRLHLDHRGRWMRDHFLRELRHVYVLNPTAREEYAALPFEQLTIHDAFNGIELSESLPRWAPEDPPTLLCLGRLRPEKGSFELLDAFGRCRDDFPQWRLLFLGDGPQWASLREEISRREWGDRVEAPGATTEPLEALARASLLVLPSKAEGMSNTLLESMAVGTPAVATAVGANTAMLADGAGWLSPSCAPDELADTLRRAMADPDERARRGDAASRRVRDAYSIDAAAARFEEIYAAMGATR